MSSFDGPRSHRLTFASAVVRFSGPSPQPSPGGRGSSSCASWPCSFFVGWTARRLLRPHGMFQKRTRNVQTPGPLPPGDPPGGGRGEGLSPMPDSSISSHPLTDAFTLSRSRHNPGDPQHSSANSRAGPGRLMVRAVWCTVHASGTQCAPGETQCVPGGTQCVPGGTQCAPGGTQCAPGGTQRVPGGTQCAPGGTQCAPGGTQCAPGGTQCVPGGTQCVPGGTQCAPGGTQCVPGEHSACRAEHSACRGEHRARRRKLRALEALSRQTNN
jgi:hypothetical protein